MPNPHPPAYVDSMLRKVVFLVAIVFSTQALAYQLIHEAVEADDIDAVAVFIAKGANVNEVNEAGDAPLNIAFERGNERMIDLLERNGACFAFLDLDTRSVIHDSADLIREQNTRRFFFAQTPFGTLPADVLALTLSFLTPVMRNRGRLVCKRLRDIIDQRIRTSREEGGLGLRDVLPIIPVDLYPSGRSRRAAPVSLGNFVYTADYNRCIPINALSYELRHPIWLNFLCDHLAVDKDAVLAFAEREPDPSRSGPFLLYIPGFDDHNIDLKCAVINVESPGALIGETLRKVPTKPEDPDFVIDRDEQRILVIDRLSNKVRLQWPYGLHRALERFGRHFYVSAGDFQKFIEIFDVDSGKMLARHHFQAQSEFVGDHDHVYCVGPRFVRRRRIQREEDFRFGVLSIDRRTCKEDAFILFHEGELCPWNLFLAGDLLFVVYTLEPHPYSLWVTVINRRTHQTVKRIAMGQMTQFENNAKLINNGIWFTSENGMQVLDFSGWNR